MKEGGERACDNCGKIYKAIYFPYKFVNQCINCYEDEHGIVLHKHRRRIVRKSNTQKIIKFKQAKPKYGICSNCQSELLIIDETREKVCSNCNKTAKFYQKIKSKRTYFQKESDLEQIINYLKLQERKHKPIRFWYRNDAEPRIIYDYYR